MPLPTDFTGPTFLPGTPGYDDERSSYNNIVQHEPHLIVGAASATDIQKAIRYAAATGLSVGVHRTGHGISVSADGVLITTRRLDDIQIDPAAQTATIGAGVLARDLLAEAVKHDLAPLNGSSPDVGVIGYLLGGGLPLLGRTYGHAAEYVLSLDVVTADGQLRTVTPDHEPDLYWALLGGRGNYGIVSSATIRLLPITRITGGGLWFTGTDIAPAVAGYLDWTRTVDNHTNTSVLLIRMPDLDVIPRAIRGQRIAHIRFLHDGPAREGQRVAAGLRAITAPVLDTINDMPYADIASIHNEPHGPVTFHARSSLLDAMPPSAVKQLLTRAGAGGDDTYFAELRHLGGALTQPSGHASLGRSDATYNLYTGSALGPALDRDAAAEQQAKLHDALHPNVLGPCTTFLSGPGIPTADLVAGFGPTTFDKLAALKEIWDPTNMLRINQNIPPIARDHANVTTTSVID